jgi:SAM-dependent methyltransferase
MVDFKSLSDLNTFFRKVRFKLYDILENVSSRKTVYLKNDLALFWPNSAGRTSDKKQIAFNTLKGVFTNLARFSSDDVTSVRAFRQIVNSEVECGMLDVLLRKYGSDKSLFHNYDEVYEVLFADRQHVTKVFEIGMGSPNLEIVSNMGAAGKPGASLRAFQDFFPNATVMGADIDKEILFSEQRIRTFYLDQLNVESFAALSDTIGSDFDLVIDDGLHAVDANLNVLHFFIPLLKHGGYAVIEDIPKAAIPFWLMMVRLLSDEGKSWLVDTKNGLLFVFKKT